MAAEWHRYRWSVLYHPGTGKVAVVDQFERRLSTMRKRIVAWAEVMKQYRLENPGNRMVMMTLTYDPACTYEPGHMRDYLSWLKARLLDRLIGWAWVAELQEREEIHYHLQAVVRKGSNVPTPDASGMWPWGMSQIETARSPYYLVKYVGKEYQKDLARYPKGCRLYGVSLRGVGEPLRASYRVMAGMKFVPSEPGWEFGGSAVTAGYVESVLVPRAEYRVS